MYCPVARSWYFHNIRDDPTESKTHLWRHIRTRPWRHPSPRLGCCWYRKVNYDRCNQLCTQAPIKEQSLHRLHHRRTHHPIKEHVDGMQLIGLRTHSQLLVPCSQSPTTLDYLLTNICQRA
jgi:hypothetical protein